MKHQTKPAAAARATILSELRSSAWAIRPEALNQLVGVVRGEVTTEDVVAQLEPAAAARPGAVSQGGVMVLTLRGVLTARASILSFLFGGGGSGLMSFRAALRDAVNADDVSAIVIDIDSPGGSTDLVAETAADLRAARSVKPVIAVANTGAGSGAYWLGAQADEFIVTPSGQAGSIGVFLVHEDWSKYDEELGVNTTLIKAGKYKGEGNRFEPLSDEAQEALQATVDDFYGLFVADVAKGRGVNVSAVKGGYGEGRMLTAKQALTEGMVDRIDTLEATIARLVRNPSRIRRRTSAEDAGVRLAAGDAIENAEASDVRTAAAILAMNDLPGTPALTPPSGGQEAAAQARQSYVDLMYGVPGAAA